MIIFVHPAMVLQGPAAPEKYPLLPKLGHIANNTTMSMIGPMITGIGREDDAKMTSDRPRTKRRILRTSV